MELNQQNELVFNNNAWTNSKLYLYSIDLFNHQYWWETHEVLEKLWIETTEEPKLHNFLQGLILISAALLKKCEDSPIPAIKLYKKSIDKINIGQKNYLGINVESFIKSVESYLLEQCNMPPIIELLGLNKQ